MFVVGMNVHNPSEYTFINLILLKVDDKYPADNSYFLIGFLFGHYKHMFSLY
jgi:hypothetical protein